MFPIANHKSQVICATITTKALLCILISDSRFKVRIEDEISTYTQWLHKMMKDKIQD